MNHMTSVIKYIFVSVSVKLKPKPAERHLKLEAQLD